ncbi:unnamed protein product [Meganyctiphanes norvegica]|uniref:Uncharacterized protein n=1 Tax=Meganyctiphanes norvegica TaxID=48144 RepID=A0AAV2S4L5_MEGNR
MMRLLKILKKMEKNAVLMNQSSVELTEAAHNVTAATDILRTETLNLNEAKLAKQKDDDKWRLRMVTSGLWLICLVISSWRNDIVFDWMASDLKTSYQLAIYSLPFVVVQIVLNSIVTRLPMGNVFNLIQFVELVVERICLLVPIAIVSGDWIENPSHQIIHIVLTVFVQWVCSEELQRHGIKNTLALVVALLVTAVVRNSWGQDALGNILSTVLWFGFVFIVPSIRKWWELQSVSLKTGLWLLYFAMAWIIKGQLGLAMFIRYFLFHIAVIYLANWAAEIMSKWLGYGNQTVDLTELAIRFGVICSIFGIVMVVELSNIVPGIVSMIGLTVIVQWANNKGKKMRES